MTPELNSTIEIVDSLLRGALDNTDEFIGPLTDGEVRINNDDTDYDRVYIKVRDEGIRVFIRRRGYMKKQNTFLSLVKRFFQRCDE